MAKRKRMRRRARVRLAAASDLVVNETAAAGLLLLSPRTLQRFRVQGRGPRFLKLGKRIAYTRRDLEEYIENARRVSTSQEART